MSKYTMQFTGKRLDMLRATMACAGKKDARYWLNGLHINQEHIVATDGARIACFENIGDIDGNPLPESDLGVHIIPPFKIPSTIVTVNVTIGDNVTIEKINRQGGAVIEVYQKIDGQCLNYRSVLPAPERQTATDTIAFNPSLIADIQKAVKDNEIIQLRYNGPDLAMYIDFAAMPDLTVVVMPGRFAG